MKGRLMVSVALALAVAAGATRAEVRLGLAYDRELLAEGSRVSLSALIPPATDKRPADEELPLPWGWFMGPMFQLLYNDMSVFNPMTKDRQLKAFSQQMFLYGITVGLINGDWRGGLCLLYGEQNRSKRVLNKIRDARIEFLGVGAILERSEEYKSLRQREYPAYVPYIRWGYIGGVMAGMGRLYLMASGHDLAGAAAEVDPDDYGKPNYRDPDTSNNTLSSPERTWEVAPMVMILYPYLGVWSSPYNWLWVELDVGYLFVSFDTSGKDMFAKNGVKMVSDKFEGGFQTQVKIVFGQNPNFKAALP
jgi:hypothetical protein